ncbi:hypothetical protein CCS92_34195, partial [Methylobacterium radiotolerans]
MVGCGQALVWAGAAGASRGLRRRARAVAFRRVGAARRRVPGPDARHRPHRGAESPLPRGPARHRP